MPKPRVFQFLEPEERPNNYTRELPPIDKTRITAVLVRRSKKAKPLSEEELAELKQVKNREDIETTYIESREAQLELVNYAQLLYGDDEPKVKLYDEGDGVSGQKRIDQREIMNELYQDMNKGIIGTIVAVREDRLFRNKHMDQVGPFTKRAEEKKMILIVPPLSSAASDEETRVYDFTSYYDLSRFQDKMKEAYGYIEGHVKYMAQCKQNKADKGGYDGRALPPGLVVKGKKQNQKIVIYEPWAEEIKKLALRAQALDWDMGQLYREVANVTRLFPEIPDEDRDQYIINTHMLHIPGVGYKPRYPETIRNWFKNEMYIGWWQPDEDKPFVWRNHHPAILEYDLFAEGYARITGYTINGEPVDNPRGVKRIQKKREVPPNALFHSRLIATPPSVERTAFVSVIEEKPGVFSYRGYSTQIIGIFIDSLFIIPVAPFDALVIERLKVLISKDKDIADKVGTTLEQMYKTHEQDFKSIHDQLSGIEEQLVTLIEDRDSIGEEILKEKRYLKKANLKTSSTLQMWEGKLAKSTEQEQELLATKEDLEHKKEKLRIIDSPEDIERIHCLLEKFDKVWPKWDLAQRQRAFSLLINRIEVEVISPHWLHLSIDWLDTIHGRIDDAYVWRVIGTHSKKPTQQEKEILKQHYPSSPREELLKLLPDRTWRAIRIIASSQKLKREIFANDDMPVGVCYRDFFMPDGNYLFRDYETTLEKIKEASRNTARREAPFYPLWLAEKDEDLASLLNCNLADGALSRSR